MAEGFDSTTFLVDYLEPKVRSVVYQSNFAFDDSANGGLFEDRPIAVGDEIKFPIEYSFTSNAGTFAYGDAMKESDDSAGVIATFTKDAFDCSLRGYKLLENWGKGTGDKVDGSTMADNFIREPKIRMSLNGLRAAITSTVISDMETQVDSAGTFSDAALTRATYGLASYEDTAGGVITQSRMEDAIASLMGTSYGEASMEDLVWYVPLNQFKRIAKMQSATIGADVVSSLLPMVASSESSAPIDAGRLHRTKEFDGIPLIVVPGMTTTNTLLLRRGTWGRYNTLPFEMEDKSSGVMAYQWLYNIVLGVQVVCDFPSWNGKISGLTA